MPIHSGRIPRRAVTFTLLATLAASGACARRTLPPVPDGTEAAPFDVRHVDVAPRVVGCTAGLVWSRSGIQTPTASGGGPVTLVVSAEGRVVPGSVNQRRRGDPVPPPLRPGTEQDVLTCRYQPGVRNGQPVAVRTTTWFTYP